MSKDKSQRSYLLKTAAEYDLEKVKSDPKQHPELVNWKDNETGLSALHLAAKNGHIYVAEFPLTMGADVDSKENDPDKQLEAGDSPLHKAAARGFKAQCFYSS